jgi:hypothetical protein
VDGEIVFPATGHLELAWAVAGEQYRHEAFFLENLQFDSPLILPDNSRHPLDVRLEIVSGEGDYRICSRPADAPKDLPWSKHSTGRINTTHDRFEKWTVSLAELRQRFHDDDAFPVDPFYETLRKAGLHYEEKFRCIRDLWHHGHEILAHLQLADELVHESQRYTIHPALLDACLHVVFADVQRRGHPERVFLPYRIDRVRFYRRPTRNVWSHVRVTRNDEKYLCSDTLILDEAGELVAELHGMTGKRLAGAGSRQADTLYEGCYEYRWTAAARDAGLHGRIFDTTTAVLITGPSGKEIGSEGGELAAELGTRFAVDGIQPLIIPAPSGRDGEGAAPCDSFDMLLADVPLDRRTLIVFAASVGRIDHPSINGWEGLAGCPYVPALLQLAQTLLKREGVPQLFVVTNGAAGMAGDKDLDLGQAILHGMARVINNECANVPLTVIDLSQAVAPGEVNALFDELLHSRRDRDESEIAIRGDRRYVRKLVPLDRDSAEQAASSEEAGVGGDYRADLSEPGMLDQMAFRQLPSSELGEEDVEIAVQAAALNFKDIMNAMGMLSENAVAGGLTGHRLGLEVAGRVLRTGRRVRHVQTGDEAIARVPEGFRGRVTTHAHYVVPRPEHLTPQQAVTIPLVYVTAW